MSVNRMPESPLSQEYLDVQSAGTLVALFNMAYRGQFKNSQDVLNIARKAYPHMKTRRSGLEHFVALLAGCVNFKRISLAQAEHLVRTDMKELLDENFGDPAKSVGASRGGVFPGSTGFDNDF